MKNVTVLLMMLFALQLPAVNKSSFDIKENVEGLAKSNGVASNGFFGSKMLSNDFTSYSMMSGGYFTIGTTNGLSDSPFDDGCEVTFGHPYALTSYPILAVDGVWGRPDQLIADMSQLAPGESGVSLFLNSTVGKVDVRFQMTAIDDGRAIKLSMTLKNNDSIEHRLGMGLVLDPALGQWGDGALEVNGEIFDLAEYFEKEFLSSLRLWERVSSPLGLGVELFPDVMPDTLTTANWSEMIAAPHGQGELLGNPEIYDLCLKMLWMGQSVQPGDSFSRSIDIRLLSPDFPPKAFMRWDMPTALTLQDNLLFPRTLNTALRVMNLNSGPLDGLSLAGQFPFELSGEWNRTAFSVASASSSYQLMTVNSKEIYEELVVPVQIECRQNGQLLDCLRRNIYMPATPVSDEGLLVQIDSTWTTPQSTLNLVFGAEKLETGQKLLALEKENILLYDNEKRIKNFAMEKYGAGGAALADICFVLDCSGSMGDNIDAVRNNVGEFADSLLARGFDYRIAIVTFSTLVDDVWDFSDDIDLVKSRLASIGLWGGIEDSPAALYKASELSWRDGSKRNIIWVTDEPYPETSYTQEQIVDRMLAMDIKVHGVGLLELQTDWFNPIIIPTGGNFYNIFGNFRDILLDVARMKSQDKYLVTFDLADPVDAPHNILLKVHYAGLGGQASVSINGGGALGKKLACYPNPFNPLVRIRVDAGEARSGRVDIFDVLGRQVRRFEVTPQMTSELLWDARDENGLGVSSGFYLVRYSLQTADGSVRSETQKVLYLK